MAGFGENRARLRAGFGVRRPRAQADARDAAIRSRTTRSRGSGVIGLFLLDETFGCYAARWEFEEEEEFW